MYRGEEPLLYIFIYSSKGVLVQESTKVYNEICVRGCTLGYLYNMLVSLRHIRASILSIPYMLV